MEVFNADLGHEIVVRYAKTHAGYRRGAPGIAENLLVRKKGGLRSRQTLSFSAGKRA